MRADGKRKGYDEIVANDQTAATPRTSQRTVAFQYDDAGRLIKEESRDGEGVAYELNWALDKVGNRTLETRLKAKDASATDWTGGSLTRVASGYSSNGTDWLTATTSTRGTANAGATNFVGATTATQTGYGYDSNGSQIRKTTESADASNSEGMEWSFEGALLRVEKGETQATKFTYDASGNRVQALTRDGAKMSAANYLVDENTAYAQVLEERDAVGELQARYVYGQGYGPILLQRVQKNGVGVEEVRTRYLLADGHGSVRQLVNASGVVTDSYFYDAWGGGLSGGSGTTVNPYRYNGQQTDEATGGYYLRARYYQPGQGRFLGHDPLLGSDSDPVSLHRYLYGNGDGVNVVDPRGQFGEGLVGLMSTIAVWSMLHQTEIGYASFGAGFAAAFVLDEDQGRALDFAQMGVTPVMGAAVVTGVGGRRIGRMLGKLLGRSKALLRALTKDLSEFADSAPGREVAETFYEGLRGQSVRSLDLDDMPLAKVRQTLQSKGFTQHPGFTTQEGTNDVMELWHHMDGGYVRIKPNGVANSQHTHMLRPHAVKAIQKELGSDFSWANEGIKVDRFGNARPAHMSQIAPGKAVDPIMIAGHIPVRN